MMNIDHYLSRHYSILLTEIDEEDGGGWLAEIPLLPGCMSDGQTQAEALEMIEDAKRVWLESSLAHDDPILEPE